MALSWIGKIGVAGVAKATAQADDERRKSDRDSKLVDVAHEVLSSEEAARDRATLEALVKLGWPHVQREQFKGKVRKKVWQIVSDEFQGADADDMIDEITERIADAAEADQYFRKMFDSDE